MSDDWRAVRSQLLAVAPERPSAITAVTETGLYAWWDLGSALAGHYPSDFPDVDVQLPLYVGLAKDGSLGSRCWETHLAPKTRRSTLRRSLSALLDTDLGLRYGAVAHPKRKFSLSPAGDAALTAWMLENLRLTWTAHVAPDAVERQVIDSLLPPLNDRFAHRGLYWRHMDRVRADFHSVIEGTSPASEF